MVKVNLKETGKNIKNLREKNRINIRDIASKLNLASLSSVYNWQNGKALPTLENVVALARMFNVTVEDIVSISEG